jgi:hypothetical protein
MRLTRVILTVAMSLGLTSQALAQLSTPCEHFTIPAEQTRKATRPVLTCGGGLSEYTRTATKLTDQEFDAWYYNIKLGDQLAAQKLFLDMSPVEWSGDIPYHSYVEWTWQKDVYGENEAACGSHMEPYQTTCTKTVDDEESPICTKRATPPPVRNDPPSFGGGSSGGNSSGGGSSSGGSSRPRRAEPAPVLPKSHREENYNGGGRRPKRSSNEYQKLYRNTMIMPVAYRSVAAGVCPAGYDFQGYNKKEVSYSCTKERKIIHSCHYDVAQSERVKCQDLSIHYDAKYAKPGSDWNPQNPNYHELLPNKYDLMPREWEKVVVISNEGISQSIHPQVAPIENAWNKYDVQVWPQQLACRYNDKPSFKVQINTAGRIKRKSPNAFVTPVDRHGDPQNPLARNAVAGKRKGDVNIPGEPYKVTLQDASYAVVLMGSDATREFAKKMDPNAPAPVKVAQKGKAVTSNDMGGMGNYPYWKDTQVRVRLVEKVFMGRDIPITQDVYTNSSQTSSGDDYVNIPLTGENGVQSIYRATGPLNSLLGTFWSQTRVHLTPGHSYEIRVSMYQRGLPFYESGCKQGTPDCEAEKANKKAFSDDLVIEFKADSRIDERTWLNKLRDFQTTSNPWEKLKMLWPF